MAVSLENAFRNFSTLTKGDNIEISYNDNIYGILVMEIKPPGVGISIVETDLEVDFAPPVGYQEPTPVPRSRPIMVRLFCSWLLRLLILIFVHGVRSYSR